MHVRCHGSLDYPMFCTFLHNDSVLTDLLLNQNYLLGSIDYEVAAGIQWAFLKPAHVIFGLIRKDAPRTS